MMRNPVWSRQEIILALDLFQDLPSSRISSRDDDVRSLSNFLRLVAPLHAVNPKFRNPNGVALKLHNLARFDPSRSAMKKGGKLEKDIWDQYLHRRADLKQDAERLRETLRATLD